MDSVIKVAFAAVIAVMLGLALRQQGKDIALLLSVAVCCMVIYVAVSYLAPVVDFVREIQRSTAMDPEYMHILLKAVGIGMIAEIAGLICKDAGNAALEKTIHILASAVILCLALPLMRALLAFVRQIMEEI